MELNIATSPASSSSTTTTTTTTTPTTIPTQTATTTTTTTDTDPMHTWWESVSKARSHIHSLSSLLPSSTSSALSLLADSDRPALSLLSSYPAYSAVSLSLSSSSSTGSGSGSDPLCHWLYDTFLSNDPHLRLVVLSFIPILCGTYLSRIHNTVPEAEPISLSGFEAVLLAVYSSEVKSRGGKPVVVNVPDLSLPSLYHTPRQPKGGKLGGSVGGGKGSGEAGVGVIWPVLEPQVAVKSTKRGFIVGVVLDCYLKVIGQMPSWSKVEFCEFVNGWAGQECCCRDQVDEGGRGGGGVNGISVGRILEYDDDEVGEVEIKGVEEGFGNLRIENGNGNGEGLSEVGLELNRGVKGVRIPMPWELLQPVLRILGHCLLGPLNSQDVKDAASMAVRGLYARASHDLNPQAILATRSLIQLDKRARETAKVAAVTTVSSTATTPSKSKKPEVLLVSK